MAEEEWIWEREKVGEGNTEKWKAGRLVLIICIV